MAANLKSDPITTISGTVLVLVAVFMWIYSYLSGVPEGYEKQWYVPFLILILGVILIKAPDSFVRWGNKVVDKKTK